MILYYYSQLDLLAMWYYKTVKGKKELWLWVHHLNNKKTQDFKAIHDTLDAVRLAPVIHNWRRMLEDSGDE